MAFFPDSASLERLLESCRRGDSDAWARLIEATRNLVWSAAKGQGMSDDDASDAFQATYIALHGALGSIRSGQALPKWLSVTTVRECHRIRRRNARTAPVDAEPIIDALPDLDPTADEKTQAVADAFLVRESLAALGGKCQDLLERLYFAVVTDYTEVARDTGMPIGSIGPTRARCLAKLRKLLEKVGFFGSDVSGAWDASSED